MSSYNQHFNKYLKMIIPHLYKQSGLMGVTNSNRNTLIQIYSMFKLEFVHENHLEAISECPYQTAMANRGSSSHIPWNLNARVQNIVVIGWLIFE